MEHSYMIERPDSYKSRKRVGRGGSSGHGKTSCRGGKGQTARTGSKHYAWFEGGQMPLQRRIPKRGFKNVCASPVQIVNVSQLEKLADAEITFDVLKKARIINDVTVLVKVLANGELTKKVKVHADICSKAAMEKIQKAGGEVVLRK